MNIMYSNSGLASAPKILDNEVRVNGMINRSGNIVKVSERIVGHTIANQSRDHQPYCRTSVGWRRACRNVLVDRGWNESVVTSKPMYVKQSPRRQSLISNNLVMIV